jgi:hypothetical protein
LRRHARQLARLLLPPLLAGGLALGTAACDSGPTNTSHNGPQHAQETKPTYQQD